MKTLKEFLLKNWVLVALLIILFLYIRSLVDNSKEYGKNNKKIIELQSKNIDLEKDVIKKRAEVNYIRSEKKILADKYKFTKGMNEIITEDLQNLAKIKRKEIIIYKDRIVKESDFMSKNWNLVLSLESDLKECKIDFEKYIDLDFEEQKKTDKIILDQEEEIFNYKKIIGLYDLDIEKLLRKSKRRFNLSIGFGVGYCLDGSVKLMFGVYLGYKIL